jgi:hypothetical protein
MFLLQTPGLSREATAAPMAVYSCPAICPARRSHDRNEDHEAQEGYAWLASWSSVKRRTGLSRAGEASYPCDSSARAPRRGSAPSTKATEIAILGMTLMMRDAGRSRGDLGGCVGRHGLATPPTPASPTSPASPGLASGTGARAAADAGPSDVRAAFLPPSGVRVVRAARGPPRSPACSRYALRLPECPARVVARSRRGSRAARAPRARDRLQQDGGLRGDDARRRGQVS